MCFAHYMFNTRYNSHTDPLFKSAGSGILKLTDIIYTYKILVFMYDYSKSKLIYSIFRSTQHLNKYNREIQEI